MHAVFTLEARLGNAEFRRVVDLAHALESIASTLLEKRHLREGRVFDINGNTVVTWQLVEDPD